MSKSHKWDSKLTKVSCQSSNSEEITLVTLGWSTSSYPQDSSSLCKASKVFARIINLGFRSFRGFWTVSRQLSKGFQGVSWHSTKTSKKVPQKSSQSLQISSRQPQGRFQRDLTESLRSFRKKLQVSLLEVLLEPSETLQAVFQKFSERLREVAKSLQKFSASC